MKNKDSFKNYFNAWISLRTDPQLNAIDKICSELDIEYMDWFNSFLDRNAKDYFGTQFLKEMLSDFVFYIQRKFFQVLLTQVPPKGKNIYGEPYLGLNMTLRYSLNEGFYVRDKSKKHFRKLCKTLSLEQRSELMKNNLFSYIVNKTNLEIFNKKELRILKLKKLDGYNKTIEQ